MLCVLCIRFLVRVNERGEIYLDPIHLLNCIINSHAFLLILKLEFLFVCENMIIDESIEMFILCFILESNNALLFERLTEDAVASSKQSIENIRQSKKYL